MRRLLAAFLLLCALALSGPVAAHGRLIQFLTDDVTTTSSGSVTPAFVIPVFADHDFFIHCYIVASAAATTTGIRWGYSTPTGNVAMIQGWAKDWNSTDATEAGATVSQLRYENALGAFTRNNTDSPGTTRVMFELHMLYRNTPNDGDVTVWLKSEVNGSAVTFAKASWCEYSDLLMQP